MKFLPVKYRESMSEFFGKRGLSWHISAVITRSNERYDVECFVHVFNSCTQNNYSVASVLDHLFKTIKVEYPHICKAYLRSDNAGCYHNAPLILYLGDIGMRTGVALLRYDFSDPQAGKDICDRKTAPMKAHIRRYVNEKHDVVSAEDMKSAIESHGGLTGCRVTVAELDSSKDLPEEKKIPGISLLYNFQYQDDGVRMWKAYGIGEGVLLPKTDCDVSQTIDGLKIIQPFSPRTKDLGSIQSSSSAKESQQQICGCNEESCVLTFKTEREAQNHMDTGNHVKQLESVSLYDQIKIKWAEKVTGVSTHIMDQQIGTTVSTDTTYQSERVVPMGWALKTTKDKRRFEDNVKAFLIEKFEAGEKSGNKADPLTVSKEMKVKRDAQGNLLFKPEEWKTAQQIKSFFSRHSTKLRQMRVGELRGEQVEVQLAEEDLEAIEAEYDRLDTRNAVNSDINTPEHPIQVESINVCQLSKDGKLYSLKLAQLKSLCQNLQLQIEGSLARKKSFVNSLNKLVLSCSCQK